jgi:imidazolonepropionase-like amidohydrolase
LSIRYFVGGSVVDGTGKDPIPDAVVAVDGMRISAVGKRADFPQVLEGDTIDCSGSTVLPGLINSHAHIAVDGDGETYPNKLPRLAQMKDRQVIPMYLDEARRNLMAGVTTVRDPHAGPGGTIEGLLVTQELLRRGQAAGSRLFLGLRPLVMVGGHGSWWLSRAVSGIDEVKKAVRENVADGANLIKIMTAHSWGPLPGRPETQVKYLTVAELTAATEVGHRAGLPVAAHSHGYDSVIENLAAGIDSIEHGSGLTDDLVERMVKQRTYLVPTLASYENFRRVGASRGAAPSRVADASYVAERQQTGVRKAIAAGVKIAAGTDAGFQFLPHGDTIVLELELYVSLGMTPVDAIRAATHTGAKLLQQDEQIGTLEAGKLADVLVVVGNAAEDISRLRNVVVVMKEGKVHRNDLERSRRETAAAHAVKA